MTNLTFHNREVLHKFLLLVSLHAPVPFTESSEKKRENKIHKRENKPGVYVNKIKNINKRHKGTRTSTYTTLRGNREQRGRRKKLYVVKVCRIIISNLVK